MKADNRFLGRSIWLVLTLVLLCSAMIGCQSTTVVERTDEELAFAREAVLEMMSLILSAASDSFKDEGQWSASTSDLVPQEADRMIRLVQEIPGIRRLLNSYMLEASDFVAAIAQQVPQFFEQEIQPTFAVEDPFAIVEGDSDAVTRLFATHVSAELESWIETEFSGSAGERTLAAWEALTQTYNTHAKGKNLLHHDHDAPPIPLIETSPVHTITIAIIRHLINQMTTQEALVRTMAPAYEDPRIILFSTL